MFQVVVSRIPPRGDVRATQEGVSCLMSRLEPASIRDGRSAKMPSLPCRPRRVAWTFPGLCRRQFNCLVENLPFSGGLELSLKDKRKTTMALSARRTRVSSTLRFMMPNADSGARWRPWWGT